MFVFQNPYISLHHILYPFICYKMGQRRTQGTNSNRMFQAQWGTGGMKNRLRSEGRSPGIHLVSGNGTLVYGINFYLSQWWLKILHDFLDLKQEFIRLKKLSLERKRERMSYVESQTYTKGNRWSGGDILKYIVNSNFFSLFNTLTSFLSLLLWKQTVVHKNVLHI